MLQKFNEKNRDLLININGKLLHRGEAGISPFDSAVQQLAADVDDQVAVFLVEFLKHDF